MMMLIAVLAAAAQAGTADSAKDSIHITGVEQRRTIACGGRDVVVDGVDHDLTFTGGCASLALTGTDSTVVIDLKPGAPVKVEGTGNTVRWRSPSEPRAKLVGVDNTLVRQAP